MSRYPRITVGGNDTSCATIAKLPSHPDHGLAVFVESVKQFAVYNAATDSWEATGPISGTDAPTNGTSGTGVGILYVGCQYIRRATGDMYQNFGTALSPVWSHVRTDYSTS
jgi:hypothetical protein